MAERGGFEPSRPFICPRGSEFHRVVERLGVEVMTSTVVTGIDDRSVTHAGGRIPTRTVIWAAGVAASPLGKSLSAPLDHAGRVIVNPGLSVSAVASSDAVRRAAQVAALPLELGHIVADRSPSLPAFCFPSRFVRWQA